MISTWCSEPSLKAPRKEQNEEPDDYEDMAELGSSKTAAIVDTPTQRLSGMEIEPTNPEDDDSVLSMDAASNTVYAEPDTLAGTYGQGKQWKPMVIVKQEDSSSSGESASAKTIVRQVTEETEEEDESS